MASGKISVGGHISATKELGMGKETRKTDNLLIEERKQFESTWFIPPVPHQVTGDCEHGEDMNTSSTHAIIGILSDANTLTSRGIGIGIHGVTFLDK